MNLQPPPQDGTIYLPCVNKRNIKSDLHKDEIENIFTLLALHVLILD